jgi:hypothetical protein
LSDVKTGLKSGISARSWGFGGTSSNGGAQASQSTSARPNGRFFARRAATDFET